MKHAVLLLGLALAGCHATYGYRWATPAGGYSQVPAGDMRVGVAVPSGSVAGAVLIGVLLADGASYYLRLPDGTRIPYHGVPDPDPARRISVQDCTQPIDLAAGNLMCR
ncbi:MAG: hypothetical protein A2V78_03240 [Betaproteobacteria bacterium RBG_16_64_18]|nr:MAG: hypothetical protein A2V78_03240 [Betaproteobacteria bacterium RBG_16_64_18]